MEFLYSLGLTGYLVIITALACLIVFPKFLRGKGEFLDRAAEQRNPDERPDNYFTNLDSGDSP